MSEFLASNDWQWRLLRTIVQGVPDMETDANYIVGFTSIPVVARTLLQLCNVTISAFSRLHG